jgi:hypothetical protein
MDGKILLVGLGNLGSIVLELLARSAGRCEIVTTTRSGLRGEARCNLARVGAIAQGFNPRIRNLELDLNQIDDVAEILRSEKPDVILNTATMLTWWLSDLLPADAARRIRQAGFGVWLPVHLSPSVKLMKAVRAAGYSGHVVNAPFPDAVNCVLGRMGLAPACGVGNIDEIVAKVRLLAAKRLGSAIATIEVSLVAHHALERYVYCESGVAPRVTVPPSIVRVRRDGIDVTDQFDVQDLLFSPYPVAEGTVTHFLTAGSAVRLLHALLDETPNFLHAPGPGGLPGGYPVRVNRTGVAVALGSISLAEAISTNELGQAFDGIERIEANGTTIISEDSVATLKRELGYAPVRVHPDSAEEQAEELVARFREYAKCCVASGKGN